MIDGKGAGFFLWRVAYSHVLAYFFAGIFALTFMGYREQFASGSLSLLMLPVDSPRVALGPMLQILRGLVIGLVLLPLRNVFIGDKNGGIKLGLLVFGLSAISAIGPAPGSFEGVIYTVLPLQYHLLGLPETLLYVTLFTAMFRFSCMKERRWLFPVSIVCVGIVCLFSMLASLSATGVFWCPMERWAYARNSRS